VDARSCKHLAEYLGAGKTLFVLLLTDLIDYLYLLLAYEKERVGHVVAMPLRAKGTPKPDLLLAHKWEVCRAFHLSSELGITCQACTMTFVSTKHHLVLTRLCLQHKRDPTGWHMSEKLDGVRAFWNGTQLLSRLGNPFAAPEWFTKDLPVRCMDSNRDTRLEGCVRIVISTFRSLLDD
jgi:hypothetical protein